MSFWNPLTCITGCLVVYSIGEILSKKQKELFHPYYLPVYYSWQVSGVGFYRRTSLHNPDWLL